MNPAYLYIRIPGPDFDKLFEAWKIGKDPNKIVCISGRCRYNDYCSNLEDPDIKIRIGDADTGLYYVIPATEYLVPGIEMYPNDITKYKTCYLAIQGMYDYNMTSWILGTIFLKNFYIVYD